MKDFSPINARGRLPKSSPSRKQPLFQVSVETRDGRVIAVGPKAGKQFCERLLFDINRMIIQGREKDWRNPHVVPAQPRL